MDGLDYIEVQQIESQDKGKSGDDTLYKGTEIFTDDIDIFNNSEEVIILYILSGYLEYIIYALNLLYIMYLMSNITQQFCLFFKYE